MAKKGTLGPTMCVLSARDPNHLANHCKTQRRVEAVVSKWEEFLSRTVEVFFPTKLREGMTEEAFRKEQKRNVRRGVLFGVRTNIQEAERDTLLEVERKDQIITDLESKIKNVECNSIKDSEEKEKVMGDLKLTNQKELQGKESVIKDLNTKIKTMNDKNLKDHENFKTKENEYRKKVKE